jgi:hypothetical protein
MAKKMLAVQGCTVHCGAITGGSATISNPPSTKVKAATKGVYKGTLSISWAGGYYGGVPAQTILTAMGTISATSLKVKVENQAAVRQDDQGTLSGTYTNPSGSPPTLPFSTSMDISDAGQSKVQGE